jgi:hypothetical protein
MDDNIKNLDSDRILTEFKSGSESFNKGHVPAEEINKYPGKTFLEKYDNYVIDKYNLGLK